MTARKMSLGSSIRVHGHRPAAWRHPDVPAYAFEASARATKIRRMASAFEHNDLKWAIAL